MNVLPEHISVYRVCSSIEARGEFGVMDGMSPHMGAEKLT